MAGLSHGNTNTDLRGCRFRRPADVERDRLRVRGRASRGVFGVYRAGDRFRVAVEGGVVATAATACCSTRARARRPTRCWWTRRSSRPERAIADVVVCGRSRRGGDVDGGGGRDGVGRHADEDGRGSAGTREPISTRAIASGDGFVSFTRTRRRRTRCSASAAATRTRTTRTSTSAILLARNGTYYVFESGTSPRRVRRVPRRRSVPGGGRRRAW